MLPPIQIIPRPIAGGILAIIYKRHVLILLKHIMHIRCTVRWMIFTKNGVWIAPIRTNHCSGPDAISDPPRDEEVGADVED
jgi:hypothetical protein